MTVNLQAFVDELEKIATLPPQVAKTIALLKKVKPQHLKYPAAAAGGIAAWKAGETAKRRYDIGKAYEEAQGG